MAIGNTVLFVAMLITAIFLVFAGVLIARWFAPRSQNAIKGDPYECGIPTRGTSWVKFRVGYYLFAIIYLVFDVETVMLLPWATVAKTAGVAGLETVLFFLVILTLGLAYAWRKGALKWK